MPQLNGLRAICVLVVIFHHWTGAYFHFRFPFEAGAFFFFVLSGFLITRILLYSKEQSNNLPFTYRNFIVRRSLRVFPGFLCLLIICLLRDVADVRQNLLWYLSGLVNINFAYEGWQGGADQFWTLAIEQQFYILWGIALLFCPRKVALPLLCLSFVLPTAARFLPGIIGENFLTSTLRPTHFLGRELTMTGKLTWNSFDYLAAGCLYAYARHEKWKIPRLPAHILGAIMAILYLIIRTGYFNEILPKELKALQQLMLIGGTLWVIHLATKGIPGIIGKCLEHPAMQAIGLRSYGLYLYHNLIGAFFYLTFQSHKISLAWFPLVFIGGSALLWLLACVSWKYLEEPIYRKKEKFPYSQKKRRPDSDSTLG